MLRDLLFVNVQSDFYVLLVLQLTPILMQNPPFSFPMFSYCCEPITFEKKGGHKSQDCEAHKY